MTFKMPPLPVGATVGCTQSSWREVVGEVVRRDQNEVAITWVGTHGGYPYAETHTYETRDLRALFLDRDFVLVDVEDFL